jgi:7,8-dihydropterin-6-yl-methyl-4-(beta-D-ribofuranosyl)aminobenzene 5'-phosphate synthase
MPCVFQITQTVEALQQLNPAVIVPAHCTGWHATQRIVQTMPQAYTPNSVGTTFALMSQ